MRIIYISSEAHPFSKVGGLSDVAGSLPIALNNIGVECSLFLPFTREVEIGNFNPKVIISNIKVLFNGENVYFNLLKSYFPDTQIPVFFIDCERYFKNRTVYTGNDGMDVLRFCFLSKSILSIIPLLDFKVDIVHFNDFFGSLSSVYIKDPEYYSLDKSLKQIKTYMTIHNIASQGKVSYKVISDEFKDITKLHIDEEGNINCLLEGIINSNALNTVSLTYRDELLTSSYSFGMDKYLAEKGDNFIGILNGVNYSEFDPKIDKYIYSKYSSGNLVLKDFNKTSLQKELNIEINDGIPLMAIVSRLVSQKGIDLIIKVADKILELPLQFVILGRGSSEYENFFKELETRSNKKVKTIIAFDEILEHKIYAASNFYLMPSLFEPGGLSDLVALKYGSLPIVRKTGGLADAIKNIDDKNCTGNGFVFSDYDADQMLAQILKAIELYNNKEIWERLVINALNCDFSWKSSADKYKYAYELIK